MGGYIGVGIVLLVLGFLLSFLINDTVRRVKKNSNKYRVCFKKWF